MSGSQPNLFTYTYKNKTVTIISSFIDVIGYALFSRSRKPIEKSGVNKILVARLDQIGDNFLATSFVEEIKKIFPLADVDVLTGEKTKSIWENNPFVNKIIIFNNPRLQGGPKISFKILRTIVKNLKKEKYDLFVDLRGEPLTALIGFLAKIHQRVGFVGHEVLGFLYTASAIYQENKNEWLKYNDILALFDHPKQLPLPKIYPTTQENNAVSEIIKNKFSDNKIIAIHLTSGAQYKIWPTENFAELTNNIHRQYPYTAFAVMGAKGDERFYEKFQSNIDFPAVNLIGKLSIRESYKFLSYASLFIGNDSSLAHFAGSQGVPTIGLMNIAIGGAERGKPPGNKVYILEGNNPEHHCQTKNCAYPCPNMETIKVANVFNTAKKILK
ncbi:MAG: glycosyltransferase family 9 protein [Patescibacteria group bacterium]|nr:glycosyltransferase family 9 protein [Patescibacteria group bacterium]